MAKPATFPTLYDQCATVTISFLKNHKYLEPGGWKTGTISWSQGEGELRIVTGTINIEVNRQTERPYIELNYKTKDNPINYRVQLVSIPSNIGKGIIWYFVCPNTGKRCRKLYLINGYFLHRKAFKDCFYEKQTRSHKSRKFHKYYENFFGIDKIYEQIYCSYFKNNYAGRLTKRYQKLMMKINTANRILKTDILALIRS
jgi:hypothetical protein